VRRSRDGLGADELNRLGVAEGPGVAGGALKEAEDARAGGVDGDPVQDRSQGPRAGGPDEFDADEAPSGVQVDEGAAVDVDSACYGDVG